MNHQAHDNPTNREMFMYKKEHSAIIRFLSGSICTLLILGGCATLNESECIQANWYDMGAEDALDGRTIDRHFDYAEDCSEYGVAVNAEAYRAGWNDHIEQFCTRENGWEWGISDRYYRGSCPHDLEPRFFNAYQLGRAVHDAKYEVSRIRDELEDVNDKLAGEGLSEEERKDLREEREDLKWKLDSAEADEIRAVTEARAMGFPAY